MITVKSYGTTKEFETREQAIKFYTHCYWSCEGSEQRTYADILEQLRLGLDNCTDNEYPWGTVIKFKP